jgi:hypothetical protein
MYTYIFMLSSGDIVCIHIYLCSGDIVCIHIYLCLAPGTQYVYIYNYA